MKIGLVQFAPHLGNLKKNLELHLRYIELAKKKNIDLLVFPELSLTGYLLKDLVEEIAIQPENDSLFKKIRAETQGLAAVLGFVEEKEKGLFYNSSAYLSKGKTLSIHRKVFLPTYGMFDEARFYAQGRNFKPFPTPLGTTGMLICYDFLHFGSSYLLFVGGAEFIIVLSAAPGRGLSEQERYSSSEMWELMGEAISRFTTSFLIYCNRVGFEDGIQFAGGSFIFNPEGKLLAMSPYLEEHFLVQEIEPSEIREARKKWPYRRDEKPEIILKALKKLVGKDED